MKPPGPDYGSQISPLLAIAPLNDLGPGEPIAEMREKLAEISLDAAFAPHKIADCGMAKACLAGLWLRFDFLDESHSISQELHNRTGSFWHGIMHRREPDYENAKYWFRRVGDHEVFSAMRAAAGGLTAESAKNAKLDRAAQFLTTQNAWDPFRFIDLVASAANGNLPCENLCRQIQLREWQLLFDFCYHQAIGAAM